MNYNYYVSYMYHRWDVRSANHQILLVSNRYKTEGACKKAAVKFANKNCFKIKHK